MDTEKQHLAVRFEKLRTHALQLQLVGYVLGFGTGILKKFLLQPYDYFLTPVSLLGWLIWMVGSWQLLKYWQRLKGQASLWPILNDELIASYRLKAAAVGFAMVMLTQGIILVLSNFWALPALFGAYLSMFVGMVAILSAFLMYDRI